MGAVTLATITGIIILVPYLSLESLQLIWRSGTHPGLILGLRQPMGDIIKQ